MTAVWEIVLRLMVLPKWVVSRFLVINNFCHRCGRKAEAFTVEDSLWLKVTGGSDPLCFSCFDKAAKKAGAFPVWKVVT
jgi:hypothetical protein